MPSTALKHFIFLLFSLLSIAQTADAASNSSTISSGAQISSAKLKPIPFGDLTALIKQGLLPNYQPGTEPAKVDKDIYWGGMGGNRSEIGLFPEDHAAFIAGKQLPLDDILAAADQTATDDVSFGHFPNLYWLPYLMSGDSRYIAHMEDLYKQIAKHIRRPVDDLIYPGAQGRYLAWPLRLLGQLAYLEARNLTQERYYSTALSRIHHYFLTHAMSGQPQYRAHETWRILNFNAVTYKSHGWSSWMESMVGQTLNFLVALGFEAWRPVAVWQFEHLKKRLKYWHLKGIDSDHIFFFRYAPDMITDWRSAKQWAKNHGWDAITPYTKERQNSPTYATWPKDKLFIADVKVDQQKYPHTYRDRVQYAYGWAAYAATNNIDGAQAIADLLWQKIAERGDRWHYKSRISRFKSVAKRYPINAVKHTSKTPYPAHKAIQKKPPTSAYIWVPKRDSAGNVTPLSWQSLQVATAQQPIFYKIHDLDPVAQIHQALNQQRTFKKSDVIATFTTRSGMAFDHQTKIGWLPWSGGQTNTALNGIWKFDLNKLRWEIEAMPSNPDKKGQQWSKKYRSSKNYSIYQDEQGNQYPTLPDGHPPAIRTYGGVAKIGEQLITTHRYRYSYHLRTQQFSYDTWQYDGKDYFPTHGNYLFSYQDKGYGILNTQYQSTGWHRLGPEQPQVIQDAPTPFGLKWLGEHSVAQLDSHRIVAVSNSRLAIFDMAKETWSPTLLLKDMPKHNYTQMLQATAYVPWGQEGSILRQFTYGKLKDQWVSINLHDGQVAPLKTRGYPMKSCAFPGTKVVTMQVGTITALFYPCVNHAVSEVYVMRIR